MTAENKIEISKVILAGVDLSENDFEDSFDELQELVKTAGGDILASVTQKRHSIDKNYIFGAGKLAEIKELVSNKSADLVIFNNNLSPSQITNLEKVLDCRVIDRTMLILDIFAQRAKTAEGKLQVEAAQLKYLMPRLVGRRSDLSRLAGGIGTRGPGETKLETDRRYIRTRLQKLEEEIKRLEKNRNILRRRRLKNQEKTVAIVGYTNAGKSTLLNALTASDVLEADKLFATLDPTTRRLMLPSGKNILITDTVGFIRDLPHEIVDAFKSTLEEAVIADLILIVADVSDPGCEEKIGVTEATLEEIGATARRIVVYNKTDKTDKRVADGENFLFVSAKTGFGLAALKEKIERFFEERFLEINVLFPWDEQSLLATVKKDEIIKIENTDVGAVLTLKVSADNRYLNLWKKYLI
mgnify:FL=1